MRACCARLHPAQRHPSPRPVSHSTCSRETSHDTPSNRRHRPDLHSQLVRIYLSPPPPPPPSFNFLVGKADWLAICFVSFYVVQSHFFFPSPGLFLSSWLESIIFSSGKLKCKQSTRFFSFCFLSVVR